MKVVVNGTTTQVADEATVVDVLVAMGRGMNPPGVAVAVNGAVVHRGEWGRTAVVDEDRIEILTAVGGG